MGFEKIFDILSVIANHFTPEQRVRRIKNQLNKLEKEKKKIMLEEKPSYEKANKLMDISNRISELEKLLRDSA